MGSWRSNSTMSYSTAGGPENWGKVRLEGDEDLSLGGDAYMRNLGMGIEGRLPAAGGSGSGSLHANTLAPTATVDSKGMRRTSAMSWSSGKATVVGASVKVRQASTTVEGDVPDNDYGEGRRDGQVSTTLSLLQTLHVHTSFQLFVLESFIPHTHPQSESGPETVYLSLKDVAAFGLGPLSSFDVKYLEWLVVEYGSGTEIVVKRGWRDLLGAIFGYS